MQHRSRRDAMRKRADRRLRLQGPQTKRSVSANPNFCVHEHHDVVLRRKLGMLNRKLVIYFDGDPRQAKGFEAGAKGGTETVVAATWVAVADDKDAPTTS